MKLTLHLSQIRFQLLRFVKIFTAQKLANFQWGHCFCKLPSDGKVAVIWKGTAEVATPISIVCSVTTGKAHSLFIFLLSKSISKVFYMYTHLGCPSVCIII